MTNVIGDMHIYPWLFNYSEDQSFVDSQLAAMVAHTRASMSTADGKIPILIGNIGQDSNKPELLQGGLQDITAVQKDAQVGIGSAAWFYATGADGLINANGSLTAYGQKIASFIAGSGTSPNNGGSGASPNNTVVIGATGSITDASGNKWTITGSGQVAVNGSADTTTASVKELAYVNGTVWQENASNLWWGKTAPNASWSPSAGTSISPVPDNGGSGASPPNNTVVIGATGSITDTSGNKWTITGSGQVAVNGSADTTTASVKELAYVNGTVWQENASNLWWGKTAPNASWSPSAGTSISPVPVAKAATITLNVSEDAYLGDAQYMVKVDGAQIGGVRTATTLHASGNSDVVSLTGNWGVGAHAVQLQFMNDLNSGDRQERTAIFTSIPSR